MSKPIVPAIAFIVTIGWTSAVQAQSQGNFCLYNASGQLINCYPTMPGCQYYAAHALNTYCAAK